MIKVVTAEKMREIERIAFEERGIDAFDTMCRAGLCIAEAMADYAPQPATILVVAGKGNNGGDGYVAARYLAEWGYNVFIVSLGASDELTPLAKRAYGELPEKNIKHLKISDAEHLDKVLEMVDGVVDAMLGLGARVPVRQPIDWVIQCINKSQLPVIAVDIPTGLDANTGYGGMVVQAASTVTMGLPKMGLLTPNGEASSGRVRVEKLSLPRDLLESGSILTETATVKEVAELLPPRPSDSHKGTFGSTLIVAGSVSMPGAAVIAGMGSLRSGVGLVKLHVPAAIKLIISSQLPEALLSSRAESNDTRPTHEAPKEGEWKELIKRVDSMVVGPGLSTSNGAKKLVYHILEHFDGPLLLDADALNAIADNAECCAFLNEKHVLTPHPGELARLLKKTTRDIQANRWENVKEAANKFGCTVILKGHGTLVSSPDGRTVHIPTGNTAMSRGGSGDLVSGVIGGLMAQGLSGLKAAVLGTFVAGLAADVVVREGSSRGVLVREIAGALPVAFRELENQKKAS